MDVGAIEFETRGDFELVLQDVCELGQILVVEETKWSQVHSEARHSETAWHVPESLYEHFGLPDALPIVVVASNDQTYRSDGRMNITATTTGINAHGLRKVLQATAVVVDDEVVISVQRVPALVVDVVTFYTSVRLHPMSVKSRCLLDGQQSCDDSGVGTVPCNPRHHDFVAIGLHGEVEDH